VIVHYSVPKFDVSSEIGLNEGLKALGVTDVFDWETADFSPLAENPEELYVSSARHAARVAIDEQGCTAAAFTEISVMAGGGAPPDEMDFVLDRPFLFVVTSDTDGILFAGTVNSL
ncbi:MAG: serpin family protein, partial [Ruminiclostridium sp.]|nr:serpin family protein [Ruminiclostridium sp.]